MTSSNSSDLPEGERAAARAAEQSAQRRTRRRRSILVVAIGSGLVGLIAVGAVFLSQGGAPATGETSASEAMQARPVSQTGLPMISYAAVVPGLLTATSKDVTGKAKTYSITRDTPVYGKDKANAVGFIPQQDFSHQASVVVGVRTSGDWTLVLTTARNATPSAGHPAAAQTMGWVRTDDLIDAKPITASITVSTTAQKLTDTPTHPKGPGDSRST